MHRNSGRILLIVAAFALFLVPVAAIAAGGFTDVGDDNVFKADIQWMKDAGVTKGCNPPTNDKFCPEANVTREQMSAFMHRLAVNKVVDAKTAMDADLLDGKDSTAFAASGHDHDTDYLAKSGKATDADKLDGKDSTAFAASGHDHDTAYLAIGGTAVDADLLDGKDSNAFVEHGVIEMAQSGTEWMVRPVPTSGGDVTVLADRTAHSALFVGSGWAVIGLTGPAAIGGADYGLSSFDLCISNGTVTRVSAVAINYFVAPNVDDEDIYIDVTVQDGSVVRTDGCYTYTVDTPVGQGIGLQVTLDGGGELFSVKSVWTTAAATG